MNTAFTPIWLRILALIMLLSGAAARAEGVVADAHVAIVKHVSGHVRILRGGDSLEAAPGTALFVADRLVAQAQSSAGIVFRDGTLLTVGPDSDTAVRNYVFKPSESTYLFDVYLARGAAIYESGQIGKISPDSVKVSTPTATVGVRGTRFMIRADE